METNMTAFDYLRSRECNESFRSPRRFLQYKLDTAKHLYRKDLFSHYGCVNAIEFSSDGELLASGGDDKRVLLWKVQEAVACKGTPYAMLGEHNSNIFCLGFDAKHKKIFSAGNDEQVIVHDIHRGEICDVFLHEEAVYGLSVDPMNDNVFASACDNGRILIWDIREPSTTDPFSLARSSSAFHAVMYNPFEPRLLATANSKEGVGLWDIRRPHCCLMKFGGCISNQSSTSVRFSSSGNHLLALRRRLPPVLYNITTPFPVVEFDHPGYYNSCTMKSCCFAGDNDEYVLSGSDDFKLYCWKIPDEIQDKKGVWVYKAHLVLRGHRSIVNQVRYSPSNCLFASSGVEKIIKLWSVLPLFDPTDDYDIAESRKMYTPEEYMNLVIESGQFVTHDYSSKSVHEDPKMMAFFDSLVQRDIEGWTSDSSNSSINTELLNNCFEVQSSSSASSRVASPSPSASDSSSSSPSDDEATASRVEEIPPPSFVSYVSMIALRLQANLQTLNNVSSAESENGDNRIARLIAEKRHEQLLKAARETLKLRKRKWRRNGDAGNSSNGTLSRDRNDMDVSSVHTIFRSLFNGDVGNEQQRKKIRILQKRRARLWRGLSDSDEDEENAERSGNYTNGVVELESVLGAVPEQSRSGEETSCVAGACVEERNSRLAPEETNSVNMVVTVDTTEISENRPTVTDTCISSSSKDESLHESADSVKVSGFKRFKGNFGSRQYRSRNCDDD